MISAEWVDKNYFLLSPSAMILLKVSSPQPDTLFTGEHLQCMSVDGPGTLQSSMGHTLKQHHTLLGMSCLNDRHLEKYPSKHLMLIKANFICMCATNQSQTHTLCILHPGMFAILLLNTNPNDSPYYRLTGSNTACFVTLLCILGGRNRK